MSKQTMQQKIKEILDYSVLSPGAILTTID